jgi:hypothetical protein
LVVAGVVIVLIAIDMVHTELDRVLRNKPAPFAKSPLVKDPRTSGGFLALFIGILTAVVRGAIRLSVAARSNRHSQAT